MTTNLDRRDIRSVLGKWKDKDRPDFADKSRQIRALLQVFVANLFTNECRVRLPPKPETWVVQGQGHFHLVPELFLQISGASHLIFPHADLELEAGEALLVPPRLMHDELVCRRNTQAPFQNLVIYANGTALTCHIACESTQDRPEVFHLESFHHACVPRIHDWLADAARVVWDPESQTDSVISNLSMGQMKALVATACAGTLRALNQCDANAKQEPEQVAKVRMWITNQLGDPQLSIRRLAEQAGCTPDYLSYLFSRTTGESLVGFIVRQRLDRAASLLAESSLSGKEIAWACGFSAQSYFVRTFHKHFGVTPKAWRIKRRDDLAG